jgi:toxin ParE1/3/4
VPGQDAYRNKLNESLQKLAVHPRRGRPSSELPETHRLHRVGSHVIVYRDLDGALAVVRILHQRMQLASHLQED